MPKILSAKSIVSSPTAPDRIKLDLDLSLEDAMILKVIVGGVAGVGLAGHDHIAVRVHDALSKAGVKTDCRIQYRNANLCLVPDRKPDTTLTQDNYNWAQRKGA